MLRFRAGFRRTHVPTPTEYNMQYTWKEPVGESPLLAAANMLREDEQGGGQLASVPGSTFLGNLNLSLRKLSLGPRLGVNCTAFLWGEGTGKSPPPFQKAPLKNLKSGKKYFIVY